MLNYISIGDDILDVSVEFAKGVLFVRFYGFLSKDNTKQIKNILIYILNKGGIKYLVFNLNNCKYNKNIDIFKDCNKIIKKNKGLMFLCGIDEEIFKNYRYVNNEINALRKINTCFN